MNPPRETPPSAERSCTAGAAGNSGIVTELDPNDVLLGRGSGVNNYVGNMRFRRAVEQKKDEYLAATKMQKKVIARQVLNDVLGRGGRFLQQITTDIGDAYEHVSESKALSKCLHTLREKRGLPSPPPGIFEQVRFPILVLNLRFLVLWSIFSNGKLTLGHFSSFRRNKRNQQDH
jgi:hypothetical protein